MIKDPKTFEMDSDWDEAGFEFVNWSREYERVYVISDGHTTLLMSDEGNGHCHFVGVVSTSVRDSEPIYKIFTLNICEDAKWPTREMFGWYHTEEKAREAVACNSCDMQDHAFNYALISRSYQGGYGLRDEELAWFKWNRDKRVWESCERPDACKNLMFV